MYSKGTTRPRIPSTEAANRIPTIAPNESRERLTIAAPESPPSHKIPLGPGLSGAATNSSTFKNDPSCGSEKLGQRKGAVESRNARVPCDVRGSPVGILLCVDGGVEIDPDVRIISSIADH